MSSRPSAVGRRASRSPGVRFAWQTILRLGKVNEFTLLSLLRIVDFACEESACGFLAAMGEIGHCEVLLELVHNTEIFD